MKVLLVDDDPDILSQGKKFLEKKRESLEVETASSGNKGLEMVKENCFDAVVLDHQMPDMNGVEVLKRARSEGCDIPIIIFTGRSREEVALKALNNGANRYMKKGGDPRTQYGVLARAIEQEIEYHRMKNVFEEGDGIHISIGNYSKTLGQSGPGGSNDGHTQRRLVHEGSTQWRKKLS